MTNFKATALVFLLAQALVGCSNPASPHPMPSPTPTPAPAPAESAPYVFRGASGFSTSDLRDAHDRIVRFAEGDLIWMTDGTRLHGYTLGVNTVYGPEPVYFIYGKNCPSCFFSVRFGAEGGEPRAYLIVDYGDDNNTGTRVDVEVVNGALVVTQTTLYPPGTPTISGVVTEMTETGPVPVEGAYVGRGVPSGWQSALTDRDGVYKIQGLMNGTDSLAAGKDGYVRQERQLTLNGDLRLDFQLVRR